MRIFPKTIDNVRIGWFGKNIYICNRYGEAVYKIEAYEAKKAASLSYGTYGSSRVIIRYSFHIIGNKSRRSTYTEYAYFTHSRNHYISVGCQSFSEDTIFRLREAMGWMEE